MHRTVDLSPAENLDQRPLADQAERGKCLRRNHRDRSITWTNGDPCQIEGVKRVEIDHPIFDTKWVLEPLQLRDALDQRELAALKTRSHRSSGLLALRASTGCLATLAPDPTGNPPAGTFRPWCGLQVMKLNHGSHHVSLRLLWVLSSPAPGISFTSTRCDTLAIMPRISGRSGRFLVWPILRSPKARRPPRCFGRAPIDERTIVTWILGSNEVTSGPLATSRVEVFARERDRFSSEGPRSPAPPAGTLVLLTTLPVLMPVHHPRCRLHYVPFPPSKLAGRPLERSHSQAFHAATPRCQDR